MLLNALQADGFLIQWLSHLLIPRNPKLSTVESWMDLKLKRNCLIWPSARQQFQSKQSEAFEWKPSSADWPGIRKPRIANSWKIWKATLGKLSKLCNLWARGYCDARKQNWSTLQMLLHALVVTSCWLYGPTSGNPCEPVKLARSSKMQAL